MNAVRANVVAARGLSVNVPLAGRLTLPLWFSVVLNATLTVAATSIPPVLLHQGYVTNARVRLVYMACFNSLFSVIFCVKLILNKANLCGKIELHLLKCVFQIGLQDPTVSTAVQVALVQRWLVAAAVCNVSVTAMATLSEDTVTTRQASATAPTTLRDHIVSPAFLVTTETPGKKIFIL